MKSAGRVELAGLDEVLAEAEASGQGWLTEAEARRLAAMASAARKRQFLAGHWLARRSGAALLGVARSRCSFHRQDDGRPRLDVDGRPSGWFLSLSHSGDWLACALARTPVGVDLEFPHRPRDLEALARFTFSPEENQRLQALPEQAREASFHTLWTLKEARGKQRGEGLLPGRARAFSARPCEPAQAQAVSWPVGAGTLALAVDDPSAMQAHGLPERASPAWWLYLDLPATR